MPSLSLAEALKRVDALRTYLAEGHRFAGRGELPEDVAALDTLTAHMLAAAPNPSAASGWRPIESAPKDGTVIDLWWRPSNTEAFRVADAYWQNQEKDAFGRVGGCWWAPNQWYEGEDGRIGDDSCAKYWMPLPNLPSGEEG